MKYAIISTYPKNGTQNIGDALISRKTQEFIKSYDKDAEVVEIWREDQSDKAKNEILTSDHIIFACLAIRGNMKKTYTLLEMILDSNIPFSVIAAGTALNMLDESLRQHNFTSEDKEILKKTIDRSTVFTTRGPLTQSYVQGFNKTKPYYTGDVAFGKTGKTIKANKEIKRIGISDPHYIDVFEDSLRNLIDNLKNSFPKAQLIGIIHGKNPSAEAIFANMGLEVKRIYENPDNGLSQYEEIDMHVGYRVHGHVSALAAGKISYLLEQDGRGADYGLALGAKCSVPAYALQQKKLPQKNVVNKIISKLKRVVNKKKANNKPESIRIAPAQITSLISHHKDNDFEHVQNINEEISRIRKANNDAFKKIYHMSTSQNAINNSPKT